MTELTTQSSDLTIQSLIDSAQEKGLSMLVRTWQSLYADGLNIPGVRVVILGEFNHGKSSIINALIGEKVLPCGMTPTTQVDTWIRFGSKQNKVTASRAGNTVLTWDWQEWIKLLPKKLNESLKTTSADRIEIDLKSEKFDPCCIFIDTPGLNEASLSRESYLSRYLTNADLVIFVLDANQALTRTEQNVFMEMAESLTPQQRCLIINKCDRLDESAWLEICAYVESALARDFANERFYMVSARDESIGDWQDLMHDLKHRIQTIQSGSREAAQSRVIREMQLLLEGCSILADAKAGSQQPFAEEIQLSTQNIADIVRDISGDLKRMERQYIADLERFKLDFLRAMPRELDKAQLEDIEKWFEPFIDEEFSQFVRTQIRRMTESLNQMLADMCQNIRLGEISFDKTTYSLEAIEHIPAIPTGAFENSRGLSLWQLPIPSLLPPIAERPRREAFKTMAQKAIEKRSEQYQNAFASFFKHQHDVWCTVVREYGNCLSHL